MKNDDNANSGDNNANPGNSNGNTGKNNRNSDSCRRRVANNHGNNSGGNNTDNDSRGNNNEANSRNNIRVTYPEKAYKPEDLMKTEFFSDKIVPLRGTVKTKRQLLKQEEQSSAQDELS